jgi:hypothetical protein
MDIVKLQKTWRGYNARKKNIYIAFKKSHIKHAFEGEIQGYHMINDQPVKESPWEEINSRFVSIGHTVSEQANGNHISGIDNRFDNWKISNKSIKVNNRRLDISSYRLTSVTSPNNLGNIDEIISEIENRDNSFEYYSILSREHLDNNNIKYDWYVIPKDCHLFDCNKYAWEPKIGQRGAGQGNQVGWKTRYMDITFSMSSQLWFHIQCDDIEKYIIHSINVNMDDLHRLTYSDLFNMYNST